MNRMIISNNCPSCKTGVMVTIECYALNTATALLGIDVRCKCGTDVRLMNYVEERDNVAIL